MAAKKLMSVLGAGESGVGAAVLAQKKVTMFMFPIPELLNPNTRKCSSIMV